MDGRHSSPTGVHESRAMKHAHFWLIKNSTVKTCTTQCMRWCERAEHWAATLKQVQLEPHERPLNVYHVSWKHQSCCYIMLERTGWQISANEERWVLTCEYNKTWCMRHTCNAARRDSWEMKTKWSEQSLHFGDKTCTSWGKNTFKNDVTLTSWKRTCKDKWEERGRRWT